MFISDSDVIIKQGLVYDLEVKKSGEVKILMTLTAPNYPVAGDIVLEVKEKAESVEGAKDVDVQLTFDPPWTKDMMSDETRSELGFM